MNIGIIGLGKMGAAIATRLAQGGHNVIGYDPHVKITINHVKQVDSLHAIIQQEIIWLMVPANVVEKILQELTHFMKKNILKGCARPELVEGYECKSEPDNPIIIDGGNSFYKDSQRRAHQLAQRNIFYLDCGTSGGVHGLKDGFCLMIGGDEQAFKKAEPIFKAVAAKDGYALVGPSGAGHYVKMIHNGIEYALLQSYAEGFSILHASRQFPHLNLEKISGLWMHGSIIRSFLLELTHEIFKEKTDFNKIKGKIAEGGTGRWAEEEAKKLKLNVPALESALKIRKESHIKGDSFTMKLIALLRNKFGGHPVEKE